LTPRKGQLQLLRAFAQAVNEMQPSMLLIVGAPLFNRDHEYLQLLERTTVELGISTRVKMLGARSDIAEIMQALDLLVINSKAEPFGLVALEAMACGTPVLAAASGGIPEIIRDNENGWLLPAGDEQKLVAALISLSERHAVRATVAQQAKDDVCERFSAHRYLRELQGSYCSITNLDFDAGDKTAGSEETESARFP